MVSSIFFEPGNGIGMSDSYNEACLILTEDSIELESTVVPMLGKGIFNEQSPLTETGGETDEPPKQ